MIRPTPAAALLGLAVVLAARAGDDQQTPPVTLQHEIVVTATRTETPGIEVASSLTVITAADLARTRKTTVLEALEDVVGLATLQNGGPGAAASVSIRGANGEHTLVLLDGIELNDPINPSRSFDLAHLPVSQVERVEVLRGPQSPLYGSDALGGVINIITRTGRGRPRLTLNGSTGTYRSWNGDLGLSGSSGRAAYSLGLSGAKTGGISAASTLYPGNTEPDGYGNLSASGRLGLTLGRASGLDIMVRTVSARTEIDDFGGPYGDDPNNVQDYSSTLARIQARSLFAAGRWEQKLSVAWVGSNRTNRNPPDDGHPSAGETGLYGSSLVKLDWQNNIFLGPAGTLTAGLELAREQGRSDYRSADEYGTYESLFPSETARTAGIYVQEQWKAADKYFVAAGARLDTHSRTGAAVTFRVAPAAVIAATGTKVKATLGTGFKAPSLYQLFAPETAWGSVGNPGLKPERATGWDAGFEQPLIGGRLRFGLTYFATAFRDLIDFDFAAGYVNVGRASTRGLEAVLEGRVAGGSSLRLTYTRLRAVDQTTSPGSPLLRRPRDKFSAELSGTLFGRLLTSVSLLAVGRRQDMDFSVYPYDRVTLGGYTLLNAVLSVTIGSSLDVFLRLDNILDRAYETVWGYGRPGFTACAGFRVDR